MGEAPVNRLDQLQLELRKALAEATDRALSTRSVEPCKSRMIDAVVAAVGPSSPGSAAAAEVYGELVDLAVAAELDPSIPLSDEVVDCVRCFQDAAIALVVESEGRLAAARNS